MAHKASLAIQVEALGKSRDFLLEIDQAFVIGRASDADCQIDADSISQKHIELLWDGSFLRVRDLESSNGSFRMPQDSPFLEAHFGSQDRELSLRLAKIPVSVSWKGASESSEKTEVLDTGSVAPKKADPVLAPSLPKKEKITAKDKSLLNQSQREGAKSSAEVSWTLPIFLASVFVCAVQNFYFFSQHASFLSVSRSTWILGPAIDLYIFWLNDASVFLGVWLIGALMAIVLKKRMPSVPAASWHKVLIPASVVLFCAILVWPFVFLKESGNSSATRTAVTKFRQLEESFSNHDFKVVEKNLEFSSKLSELSAPLKGSSLFFVFWHNFQKKRVIEECGGIGEESWEKKRSCLVLLFALSLDGYTSIRPVYLGGTASSLVFLSSLDGVIRVLAAEGPSSGNVRLFVSSLTDAGLKKEADDFVALVDNFRGQSFEDLMRALLEQRLGVEKRIFDLQSRAGLPNAFRLNLLGPLEMGI